MELANIVKKLTADIEVEVSVKSNQMKINANIPCADVGDRVGLEVLDKDGKAVYYDQLYVDESYECNAELYVTHPAGYTVRLGTKNFDAAYVTYADGERLLFMVTKGDASSESFSDLVRNGPSPVVTVEFLDEMEELNLIITGYSEKKLTSARILARDDLTVDSENPNKMTYTIDADTLSGASTAKFFVIKSMQTLQPLGKEIVFN